MADPGGVDPDPDPNFKEKPEPDRTLKKKPDPNSTLEKHTKIYIYICIINILRKYLSF